MGFVEGDGSFSIDAAGRAQLIITQKDPKVLYFIKKTLGYGRIFQDGDGNYRYFVGPQTQVGYLINIFNGQLRLANTNIKFEAWVRAYNERYKVKEIEVTKGNIEIDSTNA